MNLRAEEISRILGRDLQSFTPKTNGLFSSKKFTKHELGQAAFLAFKEGIELGAMEASIEGQIIELNNKACSPNEIEFMNQFNQLCKKYNCAIQYHPRKGMMLVGLSTLFQR